MNTDEHKSKLVAADLTRLIIGASFEVINELGHGLHEKPYENALVHELDFEQQKTHEINYKGKCVGTFIPDLIFGNEVVVDTKVIDQITDHERGQMINYLRVTKLKVGLIINFKHAKLHWERVVL